MFLPPGTRTYFLVTSSAPHPAAPQSLDASLHAALAAMGLGRERGGLESAGGGREKQYGGSLGRARASKAAARLWKSRGRRSLPRGAGGRVQI